MKKCLVLIIVLIVTVFSGVANATEEVSVKLNGSDVFFDVAPQVINDRTMVPVRTIFETLGYNVSWDNSEQEVNATSSDFAIKMRIGINDFYVNNIGYYSDVAPVVVDGRTLVPLRAIGEALNYDVYWNQYESEVWLERYNDVITMNEAIELVKSTYSNLNGDETFRICYSGYDEMVGEDCFCIREESPGQFPDEIYQTAYWVSKKTGKIVLQVG